MRRAWPVLLLSMFACGGRSPDPSPSPTTTGSSTPAPPSDPGPTDTGTPAAPAIPTSGDASATLSVQRLDASPECDGLVPTTVPAPVTITRTPPEGATCAGGLSDGTGHVAVAARAHDHADGLTLPLDVASWQVFARDGTPGATFSAWPVAAQESGWQGLSVTPAPGGVGVVVSQVALGPDGGLARATVVSQDPALVTTTGWSLGGDPLGGSLALTSGIDRFHNHWSVLRAQRLDAAGAPRWAEPVQFGARSDAVLFLTAGVSRRGEGLAVWQQSAYLDVSWRDVAAGAQLAGEDMGERYPDVLGTDALHPALELVPLLDGSLAVRADGLLRRIYPHLATRSAALPGWLADRAAWSLRFTRGNAGYALLPPAGETSSGCTQTVELRAPSGRLCGQVVIRPAEAGACTTGVVDQGWDGTLVQQAAQDACSWRFWPKLLAR